MSVRARLYRKWRDQAAAGRLPGYYWHNIGTETEDRPPPAAWWKYLVDNSEISASYQNQSEDNGDDLLHSYVTGDVIVAYASHYGVVGWGTIEAPDSYRLVSRGASEDQLQGLHLHRLNIVWRATAPSLTDALKLPGTKGGLVLPDPRLPAAITLRPPLKTAEAIPDCTQAEWLMTALSEQFGTVPLPVALTRAGRLGQPYRRPPEDRTIAAAVPFAVDPLVVERGTQAHARLQNRLADHVTGLGLKPRTPGPGDPPVDLFWRGDTVIWVAEVKSLTAENEDQQLRLGLGQVLHYRHMLQRGGYTVQALLLVERPPRYAQWMELCRGVAVLLAWPENLTEVLRT
ncbi:MAG TPA: hypothetical protein VKY74_23000 [Chloroflexia bacterium]|nr:hypothetical protein [Chloroflexia bacterium]